MDRRPHLLGIDDAPFDKHQPGPVPLVGVAMEGHHIGQALVLRESRGGGVAPAAENREARL